MNSLRFCLFVNCVISDAQVIGCVVSQTTHPDDPIGAKGLSEEPLCASCPKMGQGGRREGGGGGEGTSPKSPWNSTKSLQNLGTKDIFRALWALLIVLFEIIHEWQLKETDEGKCVGMGMNPRVCGTQVAMRSLSDSHRRELYVVVRVCYLLGTNQTGCV